MSNTRHALTPLLSRLGVAGPARLRVSAGTGASKISQGSGAPARGLLVTPLITLCALFAVLALSSAPASAQYSHVFNSTFGGATSTVVDPDPLSGPAGVAVNESSGDVYVVDRLNDRVEYFSPTGVYIGQFNGSAAPTGALSSPEAIAVDNSRNPLDPSAGDVYVTDTGHTAVDKFSSTGTYLGQLTETSLSAKFAGLDGVAVDQNGSLWVYQGSGEIDQFSNALSNLFSSAGNSPFGAAPGFAVDGEGAFYVNRGTEVVAKLAGDKATLEEQVDGERTTAVAVDLSNNDVYLDNVSAIARFSASGTPIEQFGSGDLTSGAGVAVDSVTGAVYVADAAANVVDLFEGLVVPGATTEPASGLAVTEGRATLGGSVNPSSEPVTRCEFEYGTTSAYGQTVACAQSPAEIGSGNTPVAVGANLAGLTPLTTYHFRLTATNANGTSHGADESVLIPARPVASEFGVSDVSNGSARFSADLNPGGLDTAFSFEYGPTESYGRAVPVAAGELAASAANELVSVTAEGLSPESGYHVRIVATNALGTAYGPDETFTTQAAGGSFTLPDGRAWEMVSPPGKDGASILPAGELGVAQASEDGSAITYDADGPLTENPAGNPSPFAETQVLSRRGTTGTWTTEEIVGAGGTPTPGLRTLEYLSFSSDLSRGFVEPMSATPQSADATEQTLYLRNDDTGAYQPLVTSSDAPPGEGFGGSPVGITGTPDLSHLLFESPAANTASSAPKSNVNEGNIYEWSDGGLQLVNVLPDGSPTAKIALVGGADDGENLRHVISNDGSRVIWQAGGENSAGPGPLFERDTVTGETIRVDAAAPGVAEPAYPKSRFELANDTGSKVFFLSTERLTPDSNLPQNAFQMPSGETRPEPRIYFEPSDLYVFDTETRTLTDLSADHNVGETSEVQNMVLGASEDGSVVYFVATGALASGAESGKDNLYVVSQTGATWSRPRLVAVLSQDDAQTWGDETGLFSWGPGGLASRVSPNGRFLAFMSDQSLTGYDNHDAVTGRPDEEVYLYDEATESLTCVSCDPTGARPVGLYEPTAQEADGNRDLWPAFDKLGIWAGHSLAADIPAWDLVNIAAPDHSSYGSRLLTDEGRLFFNSVDSLVPRDTNGRTDVYEYEPDGAGSCGVTAGCTSLISSGTSGEESTVLDASGRGPGGEEAEDVFFETAARLAPQDYDASLDVYDAHVCSRTAPCGTPVASPPACSSGDSCKGAPTPQPEVFGAPASATFAGAGNVQSATGRVVKPRSRTTAQTRSQALRACHRKKNRAKRLACERRVRKRYPAVSSRHAATREGNR
jgi:DNA-binding beta-propeller fold protein YncE